MSFVDFKEITTDNAGSTLRYGGNDFKEIMQMLNGVVLSNRRPRIATPWRWLNNTLTIMNPANTFAYVFESSAITADRKIILPNLASDATLVFTGATNTFSEKQTINRTAGGPIEEHLELRVTDDATSFFRIENATTSGAAFIPAIRAEANNSITGNMFIINQCSPANDIGTSPLLFIDFRRNDAGAITTRPFLRARNSGALIFEVGTTYFNFNGLNLQNATVASTVTGIVDANISAHTTTKITIANRALIPSAIAYEDEANIFTAAQKTSVNTGSLSTLYRPVNGVGNAGGIQFNFNNSIGTEKAYAYLYGVIGSPTSAAEDAYFSMQLMNAGAVAAEAFRIDPTSIRIGIGNKAILANTGLLANRTYTFPDLTGKLVTDTFANIFTASQTINKTSEAAAAESLLTVKVSDDVTSYLQIRNDSTTNAIFVPRLDSFNNASNGPALKSIFFINTTFDTGPSAVVEWDTRISPGTAIATRALFRLLNAAVEVFKINAKGDVVQTITSQAGIDETLHAWKLSDDVTGSVFEIRNGSATDGTFAPMIRGSNHIASTANPGLYIFSRILTGQDSGNTPVMTLDSRTTSNSAITTRPLFRLRNAAISVMEINALGELSTIRGVALTPIAEGNRSSRVGAVEGGAMLPSGHFLGIGFESYFEGSSSTLSSSDTAEGIRALMKTGTTINSRLGFRSIAPVCRRAYNPILLMKFQLLQIGDQRMYVGFMNGSIKPTGETPLQDQAGFIFGVRTGNLNFVIIHNDVTGAQNIIDTGVVVDALLHTIMIDGNTSNGWRYKLDQAAWSSYISTDVPTSSYVLNLAFNMENTVATTKDMYHYITHLVTDK